MNEQIRLLAVRACVHAITTKDMEDIADGCYVVSPARLQQFAELIVRECMKEAWDEIIDDENIAAETDPLIREYLIGQNQGIVDAVIRFRNHFGVEE